MDDFGTGYSALSYLKRFPIHELKIDRAFVTDVARSEEDAELVAAIVAMAHALGFSVVAEGVETEEQLSALQDLDVTRAQGYLFSRPVPAAEAGALLAAGRVVGPVARWNGGRSLRSPRAGPDATPDSPTQGLSTLRGPAFAPPVGRLPTPRSPR